MDITELFKQRKAFQVKLVGFSIDYDEVARTVLEFHELEAKVHDIIQDVLSCHPPATDEFTLGTPALHKQVVMVTGTYRTHGDYKSTPLALTIPLELIEVITDAGIQKLAEELKQYEEFKQPEFSPCPFCGYDKIKPGTETNHPGQSYYWCGKCGTKGPSVRGWSDNEVAEAAKLWNDRQ